MVTSCRETGHVIAEPAACTPQSQVKLGRFSSWMFWATRGSLALLDQGLIAASNFVIAILLARWLLPQQYGSYALAFATFLLLSFFHQAILLEPQRIFGATDYADRQREYLGILLRIHLGLAFVIFLGLGISAWLIHALARSDSLPGALAGVTFAAPCILLLWLARGAFYVRISPQNAVMGAAIYCAVVFVSLFVLCRLKSLSPFSAFLIIGLAALSSSAVLLVRLKPAFTIGGGDPSCRVTFQQHWHYGRWVLLSSVLSWLTADIYFPLVGSFSGMAAAGDLKALLNFSLPIAQTLNALCVFVLPYAARAYQQSGVTALTRLTWRLAWLFAAIALAYWVVLIQLSRPAMQLLYGGRYTELAALMPLVAAGSVPWNIAYVPTVVLRAVRSSVSILTIYCASSAVAISIGIPATKLLGLRGALWATFLSNLLALLVAFTLVSRKLKRLSTREG